ncbi:SGNH/GDSL hydrolase family protein [Collinsella intestinalis]|nr:SGNH/GDSL hydrolase family protein [Collinsella intestinalis]
MRSILMVGNSLTSANNMPQTLESILGAEVVAITRGGARLAEFSNEKTRTGQRVREALSSGGFDLVIMQDMSHLAATNPEAHVRSVAAMSKLARSHDASPLLYGTWGYLVGCPRLEKLGMTAEKMCKLMSAGGQQAADVACVPLIDMASVAARYEKPEDLYAADGIHPSKAGSLLIANRITDLVEDLLASR